MQWQLPPPDPHECFEPIPHGLELAEPTSWFPFGPPSPAAERLAECLLKHRPGALVVFDTRQ
jgi:hypothetical protein